MVIFIYGIKFFHLSTSTRHFCTHTKKELVWMETGLRPCLCHPFYLHSLLLQVESMEIHATFRVFNTWHTWAAFNAVCFSEREKFWCVTFIFHSVYFHYGFNFKMPNYLIVIGNIWESVGAHRSLTCGHTTDTIIPQNAVKCSTQGVWNF